MSEHNELGRWGEAVARDYLLSQGYGIDGVNIRLGRIEVDFLARKDNYLCFVEVKTRSSGYVDPCDAVDRRKRQRMIQAADMYMSSLREPLDPRFDLIFIVGSPDGYTLEHIPDAFYPGMM